ncbi:MAG: RNA 2',3'-cyclic phosphodiesterase [Candidatus Aminicenantes bacterium]|nr:RNA 2',3'-cyclic phosphodiesterase [Candidatus Aminicenantes bacterium]
MRTFFGIRLDEAARESIARELLPFKKIASSIRWTESRNVHLTLKFIGEVPDALPGQMAAALRGAKTPVPAFPLRIAGFGKFPYGADLHIFWAGVAVNAPLAELFAWIEDALAPLGIARDDRPFSPHITLGRNKARGDFKKLFALLAEKNDLLLAECQASSFQLFSSRLTPTGPLYKVLEEFPLEQP